MPTRNYSSVAVQTTLSGTINASTTTIIVGSVVGFPSSFPYTLAIDYGSSSNELVDVNSAASTTLTVTRAVDGTSGQGHSSGAVVRHVSSGRDFAESRAHEANTTAHGATGVVVGTTNTQSLSNKTLTSPTFSGTVVTGTSTFSGTPTFSGVVLYTGNPVFQGVGASTDVVGTQVAGDANRRFIQNADGSMEWGPGTAGTDTNLYRSAADTLKTDDSFTVGGAFNGASNINTGSWTSYTPTWGSSGTAPALGDGTIAGRYCQQGKMVTVVIKLTAGTTTTFGTGSYNFSLPFTASSSGDYVGNGRLVGVAQWASHTLINAGSGIVSPFFPATSTDTRVTAWTPTVPETFASTNTMRVQIAYEIA